MNTRFTPHRGYLPVWFAILALGCGAASARASGIYGTMSNFDVFNDTTTHVHGAEIEIEDVHSIDVNSTFPAHFNSKSITEYNNGAAFGTRITFSGYNFNAAGFLAPTVGQSTNGHMCVNTPGCEHFGFAVRTQPSTTRFYWLDENLQRIGSMPASIPNPTWSYFPPANPGGAPVVRAEVQVPEPAEFHVQKPDSIWMKVYKTEIERRVELRELMSNNGIVPEDESETETEWELLEGGKMKAAEDEVPEAGKSIIRRYEYFKYTGPYDEEHEPTSIFLDEELAEPPAGELGAFISANMVAANLEPEVGDLNEDGGVDRTDVAQWLLTFGENNGGVVLDGDFDDDGHVAVGDLIAMQRRLSEGAALHLPEEGNVAVVPEPGAGALALIGMLAIAGRRLFRGAVPRR